MTRALLMVETSHQCVTEQLEQTSRQNAIKDQTYFSLTIHTMSWKTLDFVKFAVF